MNRIRLNYALAYYRRVLGQAMREAARPWAARLGTTAAITVLSFVASWSITGNPAYRILLTLAGIGIFALLVIVWYLVTIPPRIEFETQQKEEALRLMSERRNIANELRNLTAEARIKARQAREREIGAESQGGSMAPPWAQEFHQVALRLANTATEILERNGKRTGHIAYTNQIEEINAAVSSKRVARADEAIVQLEALAAVFDRQILSGVYV